MKTHQLVVTLRIEVRDPSDGEYPYPEDPADWTNEDVLDALDVADAKDVVSVAAAT